MGFELGAQLAGLAAGAGRGAAGFMMRPPPRFRPGLRKGLSAAALTGYAIRDALLGQLNVQVSLVVDSTMIDSVRFTHRPTPSRSRSGTPPAPA